MASTAREKIALFVCHDLAGLLILNRVVPSMLEMGYEPVIFNTGDNRNRQFKTPTPPVVAFFNAALPRDTLIPYLESQPIINAKNHTYRQLAQRHGVEYHEIKDINDPDFINTIAADQNYRGAMAVRFLQVFEKEIISVFHEKGFMWNLHSGLLPDYKGLLLPYRAIMNGEKSYGLTLHDLTSKIDDGDIIMRGSLPLDRDKPVLDLYLDLVPSGAELIIKNLSEFKRNGTVEYEPQAKAKAHYYSNPTQEEFASYVRKGIFYADPDKTIERLTDLFSIKGTIHGARLQKALGQAVQHAISFADPDQRQVAEMGSHYSPII